MSDIATIAGEFGAALPTITHRGREYRPRLLLNAKKAEYVCWLKNRDLKDLALIRESLGAEEYEAKKKELFERFERGDYSFYGPICRRLLMQTADIATGTIGDPDALIAFIAILFDCSEDEAYFLMGERGQEVGLIVSQILVESLPNPNAGDSSPNEGTPATK